MDYDLETIYDEQIAPLMAQIIDLCKTHQLPMIASFAYRDTEELRSFCTTHLVFDGRDPEKYQEVKAVLLRETTIRPAWGREPTP